MTCGFMGLAMLQFERKLQKCIGMGIIIFKISFGEVYRQISHFMAPLARCSARIYDIPPQMKILNTVIPSFYKSIPGPLYDSKVKIFGSNSITMLYPNMCYEEMCFQETAVYLCKQII